MPDEPLSLDAPPYRRLLDDDAEPFTDADGARWPCVTVFLLCMRHDEEAAGRILAAWRESHSVDVAAAAEALFAPRRRPRWEDDLAALRREALARLVASNRGFRGLLLLTGARPLVSALDPGRAGALTALRDVARRRFDDPAALQCDHPDAADTARVCEHLLLSAFERPTACVRRFTGRRLEHHLLCDRCADAPTDPARLRLVCVACARELDAVQRVRHQGGPEAPERPGVVTLSPARIAMQNLGGRPLYDWTPDRAPDRWFAFEPSVGLVRIDAAEALVSVVSPVFSEPGVPAGLVALAVSDDGRWVAAQDTLRRRAAVVEVATGRVTWSAPARMPLGPRQPALAFATLDGAAHLVVASDAASLELVDPARGEVLAAASPLFVDRRPLERLTASPDGALLLAWSAPTLTPRPWVIDLAALRDGAPRERLAWPLDAHADAWRIGACWVGPRTVAVAGIAPAGGGPAVVPLPGVVLHDAVTGEATATLPGPSQRVCWDGHLASWGLDGASVWELPSGARLAWSPEAQVDGYHPAGRCFWRREGDALSLLRVTPA